jgi:hypothetical protein
MSPLVRPSDLESSNREWNHRHSENAKGSGYEGSSGLGAAKIPPTALEHESHKATIASKLDLRRKEYDSTGSSINHVRVVANEENYTPAFKEKNSGFYKQQNQAKIVPESGFRQELPLHGDPHHAAYDQFGNAAPIESNDSRARVRIDQMKDSYFAHGYQQPLPKPKLLEQLMPEPATLKSGLVGMPAGKREPKPPKNFPQQEYGAQMPPQRQKLHANPPHPAQKPSGLNPGDLQTPLPNMPVTGSPQSYNYYGATANEIAKHYKTGQDDGYESGENTTMHHHPNPRPEQLRGEAEDWTKPRMHNKPVKQYHY